MKVGDYVRNKYGIAKIIDIKNNNGVDVLTFDKNICFWVNKETGEIKDDKLFNQLAIIEGIDINKIKSSPNIIDLIELRDIVELYEESWYDNGVEKEDTGYYEVLAYTTDRKEIGVRNKDGEIDWYSVENLRGIITYEQIESMEYKVGE